MKQNMFKWLIPLTGILTAVLLSSCKSPEPTQAQPQKVVSKESYAWLGYPQPCPTPADAKVLIEKWTPKIVKPGETFAVRLKFKNNVGYSITHTALVEELPKDFKVIKVTPTPDRISRNVVEWKMKNFTTNKITNFTIVGKINDVGSVRYTGKSVLNFETAALAGGESIVDVIAPDLNFDITAPTSSIINKRIPVELTFKNTGTAPVTDAKVFYTLPSGILTYQGKSDIEINIGDLAPSAMKTEKIELKGTKTGAYLLKLAAIADENIQSTASANLRITKPELSISLKAPNKRFVGNVIPYDVDIKNSGDAVAENTVIELTLPDGTTLASINNNGLKTGNVITWSIGSLAVNERKTVSAKVVANRIMTARANATVVADEADQQDIAKNTDVAGISALLCSLIDIHDPVPVGETEEYVLKATNQGSLPSTKITAKCYLEDEMEFVSTSGATKGKFENGVLTFEPLPELAPQAEAKWSIIVKAVKPGDVRFKAEVRSEQLTKPVTMVEPTNFYE